MKSQNNWPTPLKHHHKPRLKNSKVIFEGKCINWRLNEHKKDLKLKITTIGFNMYVLFIYWQVLGILFAFYDRIMYTLQMLKLKYMLESKLVACLRLELCHLLYLLSIMKHKKIIV